MAVPELSVTQKDTLLYAGKLIPQVNLCLEEVIDSLYVYTTLVGYDYITGPLTLSTYVSPVSSVMTVVYGATPLVHERVRFAHWGSCIASVSREFMSPDRACTLAMARATST